MADQERLLFADSAFQQWAEMRLFMLESPIAAVDLRR